MGVVSIHWPLWIVLPSSYVFFCASYSFLTPALSRKLLPGTYSKLSELNKRCWNQNVNALLHTLIVVGSLVGVLAGHSLDDASLEPKYVVMGYIDICISLGYMLFVLPWSLHMYFWLKARKPYTSFAFCIHHTCVVTAELTYLLTQACAWYGAAAVALLEFTNWFYLPFILMKQAGVQNTLFYLLGFSFVLVYTVCRVVLGTWLGIAFAVEAADLDSGDDGLWAAVAVALLTYWGLMMLSLYWWCAEVLPKLHEGLGELLGEGYWKSFCPRWCVRRLSGEERERARVLAERRQLAKALAAERLEAGEQSAGRAGRGSAVPPNTAFVAMQSSTGSDSPQPLRREERT